MAKETKTNQDLDFNKLAEMQKENREIMENLKQATETPMFGNEDKFAQTIAEAGIKAAEATHEFNMKEIKAKLIADLCLELVKRPMRYEDVVYRAREIADKALQTAIESASVSQIAKMQHQIHYTINKDGYCDTQCPHHHDFLLHVGGRTCHECPFFVCQSYCEKYVICSHPDNTTNKDIEQKQQEQ